MRPEIEHVRDDQGRRFGRVVDIAVFLLLLAAVSAVTLTLFHRQTHGSPQGYHSDMKAYILEMQGLNTKYSFPYPVFFKLAAFIHLFAEAELSVAIATMLLNSLAIVITKIAFNRMLLPNGRGRWWEGILVSLLAVSLFFVSMLYPPKGIYLPGIKFNYLGVFSPNPFHNATYMAARPFTILAFLWYVKLLKEYEEGGKLKDYILFSVFLLIATMTKPSFTLVLVSTAGLIMLYRLIRSGFRNFVPTVWLGLTFVPTFIDLLYQFKGVFVPEEGAEGGIGFCFGEVWANVCDNIPLAICLIVAFPLLVLVLNFRELKTNTLYRFSWQLFLLGLAEAFLLYEKGFRKFDFNFSWGYMCGAFFCHFGALALLAQKTQAAMNAKKAAEVCGAEICEESDGDGWRKWRGRVTALWRRREWQLVLIAAQWLAYLWHLICGILYFRQFMTGAMYY